MRQSEQTQRMSSQGELIPERKIPMSSSAKQNSNVPLMAMTPTISSQTSSNSSSAIYKDLTSSLFDPHAPSQSFSGMSTSQTMPSFIRPAMAASPPPPSLTPSSSFQQPQMRPTLNFSSSSKL